MNVIVKGLFAYVVLRSADEAVDHKGYGSENQQHQEGNCVTAGGFQDFAGYGGDQRTAHDGEGHESQISGIVLHSKEGRGEGGCNGGTGSIGQTCEAQTYDA
jgi:hypothetical protein